MCRNSIMPQALYFTITFTIIYDCRLFIVQAVECNIRQVAGVIFDKFHIGECRRPGFEREMSDSGHCADRLTRSDADCPRLRRRRQRLARDHERACRKARLTKRILKALDYVNKINLASMIIWFNKLQCLLLREGISMAFIPLSSLNTFT